MIRKRNGKRNIKARSDNYVVSPVLPPFSLKFVHFDHGFEVSSRLDTTDLRCDTGRFTVPSDESRLNPDTFWYHYNISRLCVNDSPVYVGPMLTVRQISSFQKSNFHGRQKMEIRIYPAVPRYIPDQVCRGKLPMCLPIALNF